MTGVVRMPRNVASGDEGRYACLECGARYRHRAQLEHHWRSLGHGPSRVQADALDRAVYALEGPESADRRRALQGQPPLVVDD
jgi:hypothetical protein